MDRPDGAELREGIMAIKLQVPGFSALSVAVLLGVCASALEAQITPDSSHFDGPEPTRPGPFHVAIGFGAGSLMASGVDGAMAFRAALVVPRGSNLVTVRTSAMEEFTLFRSPSESAWDIGFLFGRRTSSRRLYASASAGLGVTGGMRRGQDRTDQAEVEACTQSPFCWMAALFSTAEYEEDPFMTVGVPFELEAGWMPFSKVGLGVSLFGNLNSGRNMLGGTVQLVLGRFR
jgi:hypothetical protein